MCIYIYGKSTHAIHGKNPLFLWQFSPVDASRHREVLPEVAASEGGHKATTCNDKGAAKDEGCKKPAETIKTPSGNLTFYRILWDFNGI